MSSDDQGNTSIKLFTDQTLRVEGTNVVRVPFGVRRAQRVRPARPERWATVVLPFVAGGSTRHRLRQPDSGASRLRPSHRQLSWLVFGKAAASSGCAQVVPAR